jgi:hypothetical protein
MRWCYQKVKHGVGPTRYLRQKGHCSSGESALKDTVNAECTVNGDGCCECALLP